jgi:hypothetical protein
MTDFFFEPYRLVLLIALIEKFTNRRDFKSAGFHSFASEILTVKEYELTLVYVALHCGSSCVDIDRTFGFRLSQRLEDEASLF